MSKASISLPRTPDLLSRGDHGDPPSVESRPPTGGGPHGHTVSLAARRPLLLHLRQTTIDSLSLLEPFFARVSLTTFEAVYGGGAVDWDAVEASIEWDMFDG
jgi:hypothetical protein